MDVLAPAAEADSHGPASEQILSDVTPAAAVLDAFHRYRLNSITDTGLQSNQALTGTAGAARTRPLTKERKGISAAKKSG